MIRSYADKFHHAKEEDILFKYFDGSQEIIQVMYKDHTKARSLVQNIIKALDSENSELLNESLNVNRDLLSHHIQKEDEILYPWMDRELDESKLIEMYGNFIEADKNSGIDEKKYEDMINNLERRFNMFHVSETAQKEIADYFKDKEVTPLRIFLNSGG